MGHSADQLTGDVATVVAPLTFIVPQDEKPRYHSQALTGGEPVFFFAMETRDVEIADMRPEAGRFTLDTAGFALCHAPTSVADLHDDAAVKGAYFAEVEAFLRTELGATQVVAFDATRRSDSGPGAVNPDGIRGVATRAHVDYTIGSGPHRAREILGGDAYDRLAANGARMLQVNLWRPIAGPVRRWPLALAHAASVAPADLVATDHVFPGRVGEIYHLAFDPGQRWYYAPGMTRDEVLLIKGWDSLDDGRARFTPHTAFPLPGQDGAPPRESIEVRTFVVIE